MVTISDPKLFPPSLKNKIALSQNAKCTDDYMLLSRQWLGMPVRVGASYNLKERSKELTLQIERLKYMAKQKDTGLAVQFAHKETSVFQFDTIINYIFDDCEIHEEYEFASLTKEGWRFFPKSECAMMNKPILVDKIGDAPINQ